MQKKSNNFLSYLENEHYDNLFKYLLSYIKKRKYDLIVDRYDLCNVEDIDIYDIGLKSVYIDTKENDYIEFDIQCNPEIQYIEVDKRRTRESGGTSRLWFTISCRAKITTKLESFYVIAVDEYNPTKPKKPLNGNLIPVIHHNEYDKYAEEILNKYYPEAFENDAIVNPYELAKRMGFNVIKRRISKNNSVFGQIYFENSKTKLFNENINDDEEVVIPKNTIIIDETINSAFSFGCENITVAHECVHGYLHNQAFRFARIYNKKLHTRISCTTSGDIKNIESDDESGYMESQANGIAPCLLLPKKKIVSSYLKELDLCLMMGCFRLDAIEETIKSLANKYQVTLYAIKKRLIDLGFDEVIGVLNWVDGRYIRNYSFKKGSLKLNETFTIKFNDLVSIIHNGNNFIMAQLYTGKYVFVENHVVLNDEKYIEKDSCDYLILTEYARFNLDECALKFECNSSLIKSNDVLMYCYLSRDNKFELSLDIKLSKASVNLGDIDYSNKVKKYNELINKTLLEIKVMTFTQAINHLMKLQNIKINEITDIEDDLSSLSRRQFERYKNGEVKEYNKRIVVAICLALKLPPRISAEIINLAGLGFTNSDEDSMLMTILMIGRNKKFDDINQMLVNSNYKPLTFKRAI